ncbi:MAG: ATP-dependent DNA helicase RecG [Phycisphaeraceae bacterium]|nr:ATP-dependent DNA helicase RecG [Phycisphaeraceae bacterium]
MPADRPISLTTKIEDLPGLATRNILGLRELGLANLGKLIAHIPLRHERLEAEAPVEELEAGHIVSARGEISATRVVLRRPQRFEAAMMDNGRRLDLVWFNALYMRDKIKPGMRLRVQGKATRYGPGLQIANPKFEILHDEAEPAQAQSRIRPVYPANERIKSQAIEQAIGGVLDLALPLLKDHLPKSLVDKHELPSLPRAYELIHRPQNEGDAEAGRRRLAYDELLLLQLGVQMKRAHLREKLRSPALALTDAIDKRIRARFPFTLTASQNRAVSEIARDLSLSTPTNRLLQGDVGSGKTAVALYAMLMAVASGHQAALMAPTELLAEQHDATIRELLRDSKVDVRLLTGSRTDRDATLADIASGRAGIVIGTHALLQEHVRFKSLALAIIDEQHRFGVHQRAALRAKAQDAGTTPHVIVMTATPIPRTLALTMFGDLDVTVIKGLPPGRAAVKTRSVPRPKRAEVYSFLRQRLDKGEQAFVVVPAIDSREQTDSAATVTGVRALVKELEGGALQSVPIAPLHGRMKSAARAETMHRFRAGEIRCLVATTIVEVGVDVPAATVMIVEHADHFGLAQLHQLRGRVGRGKNPGVCILIADEPLLVSPTDSPLPNPRLELLVQTTDGFKLAEGDWQLRGSGGFFDTRQSGLSSLRVADLSRDRELLELARRDAREWIERSPSLSLPEEALVLRRMMKTFGTELGLVAVG